jgi:phospholipid/cholesterol/gamma-HCH transport system substrate-binding protein
LIGDVTIDMQPGTAPTFLKTGRSPADAPVIRGEVAPDPSKALEAATKAFDSAGDTLSSINKAAAGIAKISESSAKLDDFLTSVAAAGKSVSQAADGIDDLVKANETNFQPALADIRAVAAKLNKTLDSDTQAAFKTGIDRFSSASARLDAGLAQLDPVFKDLGAPVNHTPSTDVGQAVRRINVLAADLELLTSKLRDGRGGLNGEGTMQKLLTQPDLHENLNNVALSANQTLAQLRAVLADLRVFAEKVSRDPGAIGRGALQSR